MVVDNVLTQEDCDRLIRAMMEQRLEPVSVSGHKSSDPNEVGSSRATAWDPMLGHKLFKKLAPALPMYREMTDTTATDWYAMEGRKEHRFWKLYSMSPVLRFMRYEAGGEHNTHYDMGYDYEAVDPEDKRRTLMSVVFYLTTCAPGTGGRTRFIADGQDDIPLPQRNHDDWTRRATDNEVLAAVRPVQGRALIFDHRQAHDVEQYIGTTPRIIIRGDITFEALD
jgi:hypothetical protein